MSKRILEASKLVPKQEIINWYIRELAQKVNTSVSSYVMKEDTVFLNHMADLLLKKIDEILDKNYGEVLEKMADADRRIEELDTEHDFWGVGMSLENDISSFKHYKMKGLHRVINTILDSQAKKRRGTIIKMEINRAKPQ